LLLLLFFEGKKLPINATNVLNKDISTDGSSNAGVWGQSPQPPEANGGSEILQLFSKKYAVLGIFWSKFLLETAFFNG